MIILSRYVKDYRDPLHGFIRVYDVEQKLIDTREYQRLRDIIQLGTTFLIYPSGRHTRFEHSLGVLNVSTALFTNIIESKENVEILGWDKEQSELYYYVLRLASLLHDIGHAPFSHATEDIFPLNSKTKKPFDHEDYTYRIITETPLSSIINSAFDSDEISKKVARIATARPQDKDESFLSELLAGDLGSDRMDYLLRDSYHLGVKYGEYDLHRLLNTCKVKYSKEKQGPELALDDGGIHSLEGFILARYFMFLEVYYHKTRRILDKHLIEFIKSKLENEQFPEKLDKYLEWTDSKVLHLLHNELPSNLSRRVLNREHYRLCFDTKAHPEHHEQVVFDWIEEEAIQKFGKENIRTDEASKSPYAFNKPPLYIYWNKEYHAIEKRSSVVNRLQKITKRRIYSNNSIRKDVEQYCSYFWKEKIKKYH